MSRIAITGAAGFVGRAVVEAALARGHQPVAVVRHPVSFAQGVEVRAVGDLREAAATAVEGCDAVIHLAARVRLPKAEPGDAAAVYHQHNVAMTENLLRAAAAAGCRRFVHASSVAPFGSATAQGVVLSEDAAFAPVNDYGRSKRDAELMLAKLGPELGVPVLSLRPPAVYGPGADSPFMLLMKIVKRGLPLPLAWVKNRRSFIYSENLADAFITAVESDAAGAFFVTDSEPLSSAELVRRIAAALGVKPRLVPAPVGVMRAAAAALGKGQTADSLLGSMAVDGGRFRDATGWTPPVAPDEALARTARAFLGTA